MQWNSSYQESVHSFANNINTREGGSHLAGFRSALTRTLNKYARDHSLLKEKEDNLSGEDVARGAHRGRLGEAARPAVRGSDEDQARQPRDGGVRGVDRQRAACRSSSRRTPRRRARSSPRRCRRSVPARLRARRATSRGASRCSRTRRCRASSPTAPSRTPNSPSSSSSRVTPRVARPSRAATATRRRCCRCAARS